jgi:hypothetical protein
MLFVLSVWLQLEAKKGLLLIGDATLACLTIPTAPLVLHPTQVTRQRRKCHIFRMQSTK